MTKHIQSTHAFAMNMNINDDTECFHFIWIKLNWIVVLFFIFVHSTNVRPNQDYAAQISSKSIKKPFQWYVSVLNSMVFIWWRLFYQIVLPVSTSRWQISNKYVNKYNRIIPLGIEIVDAHLSLIRIGNETIVVNREIKTAPQISLTNAHNKWTLRRFQIK